MGTELFHKLIGHIHGDKTLLKGSNFSSEQDQISELIPLRFYDDATGIYENSSSSGFILQISPFIGADESMVKVLSEILNDTIPDNYHIQIITWASPHIGNQLLEWHKVRANSNPIYQMLSANRIDHLNKGGWFSLSKHSPFLLRQYNVYFVVGVEKLTDSFIVNELKSIRQKIIANFASLNVTAENAPAEDIIGYLGQIINVSHNSCSETPDYNEEDLLHTQIAKTDTSLKIEKERILLSSVSLKNPTHSKKSSKLPFSYEDIETDIRCFSVKHFPSVWAQWQMTRLIGDNFNDQMRMPCPTLTILAVSTGDREAENTKLSTKTNYLVQQSESGIAKYSPKIGEQAEDLVLARNMINNGSRIVKCSYHVITFAREGQGEAAEQSIKSMYKTQGWDLTKEKYVQGQTFQLAFPFSLSDGLHRDLSKMGRSKTMMSWNVSNVAPLQGEWVGMKDPSMLFLGRRGQPFYWDPFGNVGEGNHNVSIIGGSGSGSGKSVFMQELVASQLGMGSEVICIDNGRSFENSCKLQEGEHVVFDTSKNMCLNPFSLIDEKRAEKDSNYFTDLMQLMKSMVQQMAKTYDSLSDVESGLIEQAIKAAWDDKKSNAGIDDVCNCLIAKEDKVSKDLATALTPYTSKGNFGQFFNGKSNLDLSNTFTVFEMAELENKPALRAVILLIVMFLVYDRMMNTSRDQKIVLVIDEAWALLSGNQTGDFISSFARTCRKYGGSLVTGTQSVSDYYKTDGAKAAFENSDWSVLLKMKKESIDALKKTGQISVDEHLTTLLKSLKVVEGEFSECVICGSNGSHVGRLVLDPFSITLYSTKPDVYAKIQAHVSEGESVFEAVYKTAYGDTR